MPKLTYFLGPALDEGNGGPSTRFLKRLEITRELIRKLPPAAWQYVKCHRGVADTIAFQELGFRTFVQFTHEIAPGSGEILWRQMRDKTRNVIRRAEEQLSVGEFNDPDQFMQLFERNLRRKGSHNEIDRARCRNIITASIERRRGAILAARNRHQQVVAANFCVWDDTATFYLLATRSDNSGNGAGSLLLWKAIQDSARRGLIFDFAGLGGRGSILLYSGFGGAIRARYIALRATALARAAHELKLLFGQENCFY